jgi:hypothetical protein
MIERAQKIADERCRTPNETPGMAAVKGAMTAVLIFAGLHIFRNVVSRDWAEGIVILLCGLIAFLDCRQKWNINTKAYWDALERMREEN